MADRDLVHALDVEPELAARLRDDDRAEARRQLVLRAVDLPEGEWSLADETRGENTFGLLVVEGLLLQQVELGDRSSTQLLGRGDLILPHRRIEASLRVDPTLVVATPSRVALLDDRLQAPFALWPGLALGLLEHAGRQLTRATMMAAIAQLPRVEDRVEAVFWDLADRWGRVTPDGIHVPLALRHEALARIAGGRRPTISLALAQLAERGVLRRRADGTWLLTAKAPTIAPGAGVPSAQPLVLAIAPPDPAATTAAAALGPWPPALRAELLATARRAREEHAAVTARVTADAVRYAQTRARARQVRAEAEQMRAGRAELRERAGITPASPPAPAP